MDQNLLRNHSELGLPQRTTMSGSKLIRLNKFLSQQGWCSRREADRYIEQGLVKVNDKLVKEVGCKVDASSATVELLPRALEQQANKVTVLLHKPLGIVSSQPEHEKEPAIQLLTAENHYKHRDFQRLGKNHIADPYKLRYLATAGRLDVNSTGLLVFTQSGNIARQLIGPNSNVEKEYLVRVHKLLDKDLSNEYLDRLQQGIADENEFLQAKHISILNENQLQFVLTKGRHHQIRRMCRAVGLHVQALKRVRIGHVKLGDLPLGQWRYLKPKEKF